MFSLPYTTAEQNLLLDVAEKSLYHGLRTNRPVDVRHEEYCGRLLDPAATFVTLRTGTQLRGCMGSLRVFAALVRDVAQNAYSAGFRDPRFPPLQDQEFLDLSISISVLSEPQAVVVDSEARLIERMQNERGGWILRYRSQRGLLLPSVWETISEPVEFLTALKRKAKLDPEFWSTEFAIEQFTTQHFGRLAKPQDAS